MQRMLHGYDYDDERPKECSLEEFHEIFVLRHFVEDIELILLDYFEGNVDELDSDELAELGLDSNDLAILKRANKFNEIIKKCADVTCSTLDELEYVSTWRCIAYIGLQQYAEIECELGGYLNSALKFGFTQDDKERTEHLIVWSKLLQIKNTWPNVNTEIALIENATRKIDSFDSPLVNRTVYNLQCLAGRGEPPIRKIMELVNHCDSSEKESDEVHVVLSYLIYVAECIYCILLHEISRRGLDALKTPQLKGVGISWKTLYSFTKIVFAKYPNHVVAHWLCLNIGQSLWKRGEFKKGSEILESVIKMEEEGRIKVYRETMEDIKTEYAKSVIKNEKRTNNDLVRAYGVLGALKDTHLVAEYRRDILMLLISSPDVKTSNGSYKEVEIPKEEADLANELRKCCENGKEVPEKLPTSALVLMKLGVLYKNTSRKLHGVDQKLSLIRAAVLLNGARIRFNKLQRNKETDNNISTIKRLLKEVGILAQTAAFDACNITQSNSLDIYEFSEDLHQNHIKPFRKKTAQNFSTDSPQINENMDAATKRSLEKYKITRVKTLLAEVTGDYLKIMKLIAKKCTFILGPSPCKFSLVGLGSLARGEITPFSDFEHVIVLEEGVKKRSNYATILEYFRWFAVIFQLIIVNFGETFIRSIGVRSLNDLNNPDKSKNWFYDNVTPVGIAFDGMVRHASMNPLGATEPTVLKSHAVEFIKPVAEMVQYLSFAEHLKNGYYLKEIIGRTCFVYGHSEVYKSFNEKKMQQLAEVDLQLPVGVDNIFNDFKAMYGIRGDLLVDQNDIIDANYNKSVKEGLLSNLNESSSLISIKRDIYRPIVTYVACFARLHQVSVASSFQAIDELEKRGIISEIVAHEYNYAVALACELRVRSYSTSSNARDDKISTWSLLEFWGKTCTLDFCSTLENLRSTTRNVHSAPYNKGMKKNSVEKIVTLLKFGLRNDATREGKRWIEDYGGIKTLHAENTFVHQHFLVVLMTVTEAYWEAFVESRLSRDYVDFLKYKFKSIHVLEVNEMRMDDEGYVKQARLVSNWFICNNIPQAVVHLTNAEIHEYTKWCEDFVNEYSHGELTSDICEALRQCLKELM